MATERKADRDAVPVREDRPLGSPYGPHHGKVDEASGGADSSPLDNLSSDERQRKVEEMKAERTSA